MRFPILLHTNPSPQPTLLLTPATVDFNICENAACYYTPHPRRRLHIVPPQTKTLAPTFLPIPHTGKNEKKTHNRKTPKKIDVTLPIHSCAIPLHHIISSSSSSSYSYCTTASSHQSNQKVNSRNKRQLKETDMITEYERETHTERINAVMRIQASTRRKQQQQRQQPPRLLHYSAKLRQPSANKQ